MTFQENPEQKEAITSTEGFIRVVAGAGSGKTKALVERFAYLVNDIGVLPRNILCVTFTKKASTEMRMRIRKLTGDNDTGFICTFHSFCVTVLQEDSNAVNYPKSFLVLDNSDIDTMLQIIYEERGLTLREKTFGNARDMIEMRKIVLNPTYYEDMISMSLDELHQKYLLAEETDDIIFYGYLYQEKKCFALDYNDLLKYVLYIFQKDEEIKLKWQQRLEYIMIDEFQDIDSIQYELMTVLCDYHKNLFVVGDPDQTIYTWRGANIKYLLDFDKKFPNVKTILMVKNYRSTPDILNVVNSLISKNINRIKKDLVPHKDKTNDKVHYFHAKTTEDEALRIVEEIRNLTAKGAKAKDISILYRAHYITRPLEEVFTREKIPFTLFSGIKFFEREEIKDVLSYLRMIAYRDDLSFRRIINKPKRNIGKSRIAVLEAYAVENTCTLYEALCLLAETKEFERTKANEFINFVNKFTEKAKEEPISELVGRIADESGYEKTLRTEGSQTKLDNLAELKQSIYEFETSCGEECTLEYYLVHVALMTDLDMDSSKNVVKLMTVHAAKGLEFPHVIICGLNEGMFPSKKVQDRFAMEEERRLAFVAGTRAMETLLLTEAEGRNLDGAIRFPSRFIFDIDKQYLEYEVPLDEAIDKGAKTYITASETAIENRLSVGSFSPGDRIKHCILGLGVIDSISNDGKFFLIKFDNLETPRKISSKVKLELLATSNSSDTSNLT